MTHREKILAICVGLLVVAAGLFYASKRIATVITQRTDKIRELENDVTGQEALVHRGAVASRLLGKYRERSLPTEPQLANSRYRAWLFQWCEKAHVPQANITYVNRRVIRQKDEIAHDEHTFSVLCEADLPQLVNLLFGFYSQDYLHRIKSLRATPSKDKRLALNFTIEVIAMPEVADQELPDIPSERLALRNLQDYYDVIVARNLYAPANLPPKFAAGQSQRGVVNQRLSFSPAVEDPEKGRLTYRLEHDGLEGVTIDEQSGRIEWTPTQTGEFEVLVYAVDDGLPAKEVSQKIRLAITDPPPREDPPPRRTFDEAKYTFVTGIVEVNGRRQVWLSVRTEGKWLRLFEGDTFQVGSLDGKVIHIYPRHVEILADNALLSVRFGQCLDDGEVISQAKDGVATTEN